MHETEEFPIYRKYPNNLTFFKILSNEAFDEIQLNEKFYTLHHINAKILPDRNLIMDMIENEGGHWESSSKTEFEKMLKFCEENLRMV